MDKTRLIIFLFVFLIFSGAFVLSSPLIDFVFPTPDTTHYQNIDSFFINISSSDSNDHYTILDWNKTLALWMRFENQTGENSTYFMDESSFSNNGTCSGETCPNLINEGKFGKAYNFLQDKIVLPYSSDFDFGVDIPLTITAWVKLNGTQTNWAGVLSSGGFNNDAYWQLYLSDSNKANLQTSGGSVSSTISLNDSLWHFLAITINRSDSGTKLYVDGVFNGSTNDPQNISSNASLYIGTDRTSSFYFKGQMDEIMIFRRALSSEEINASYNAGIYQYSHNFTGLNEGNYPYTAYSINNESERNQTEELNLIVDKTSPIITLISPLNLTSSTTSAYNFTFNVTDDQTLSNCSLIFDGPIINTLTSVNNTGGTNGLYNSSLSVATHTWSVNCTDIAGNVGNSSTRTLIVSSATTTTSSSSGGRGYPTYRLNEEEMEEGYQKVMRKNWKVSFKINNESHNFKVEDVTETNAKISISSETQEATLSIGEEKKFELSGDNYYDVLVKLNSIDSDYTSNTYFRANFTIQSINEEISSPQQETETGEEATQISPEAETGEEKSDLTWLWIVIAIIIILFLSGVGYKKLKK